MEEPIDLEKYKDFLELWKRFAIYTEKNPSEISLSECFDSFMKLIDAKRRFKYHQHDASEYNNIWERVNKN